MPHYLHHDQGGMEVVSEMTWDQWVRYHEIERRKCAVERLQALPWFFRVFWLRRIKRLKVELMTLRLEG